jgi:hypothetical protein
MLTCSFCISNTNDRTESSLVYEHNFSNPPVQAVPVSKDSMSQNLATQESHWSASHPSVNRLSSPRSPRPSRRSRPTLSPHSQPSPVCSNMVVRRFRFSICLVLSRVRQRARVVVGRSSRLQRSVLLLPLRDLRDYTDNPRQVT